MDKPPAKPLEVDDSAADSLRAYGVSEAEIEAAQQTEAAPEPEEFEVYEDCWESVMFFLQVQTQWVFKSVWTLSGLRSVCSGLNYTGVESAARLAGIRRSQWPDLFSDLRLIEGEVLKAAVEAVQVDE